jgi:hypothetical protein
MTGDNNILYSKSSMNIYCVCTDYRFCFYLLKLDFYEIVFPTMHSV